MEVVERLLAVVSALILRRFAGGSILWNLFSVDELRGSRAAGVALQVVVTFMIA